MVMVPKYRLQMRWDGYGALAGVDRRVGDGMNDRVRCLLKYSSGDLYIRSHGEKFYCAFNYFPLVGFWPKFELRIPHWTILMAPNFGVAIYIVDELLSRKNISHDSGLPVSMGGGPGPGTHKFRTWRP